MQEIIGGTFHLSLSLNQLSRAHGLLYRYYAYDPSKALAGAAIGLFGVAFFGHLFWQIRTKAWCKSSCLAPCGVVLTTLYSLGETDMTPFTIAMLGECVGYGIRILSAEHPTGRGAGLTFYIIQELFIILCPALMAASHYM